MLTPAAAAGGGGGAAEDKVALVLAVAEVEDSIKDAAGEEEIISKIAEIAELARVVTVVAAATVAVRASMLSPKLLPVDSVSWRLPTEKTCSFIIAVSSSSSFAVAAPVVAVVSDGCCCGSTRPSSIFKKHVMKNVNFPTHLTLLYSG